MLTIFSLCEGASTSPRMSAHTQRPLVNEQAQGEQAQGEQDPTTKVLRHA